MFSSPIRVAIRIPVLVISRLWEFDFSPTTQEDLLVHSGSCLSTYRQLRKSMSCSAKLLGGGVDGFGRSEGWLGGGTTAPACWTVITLSPTMTVPVRAC